MKKFFTISFTIFCFASLSFAADFAPTILTLTAPAAVEYQFDGGDLTIPFTVSGTPAAAWLVINTHGKGGEIGEVENGFLGWHYVNKIDTTVYVSQKLSRTPGETTVVWDGNDQDGNAVAAGTYDYYIWAYDDQTPRQIACEFIKIATDWEAQFSHVYEVGEDGLPLTKPLLVGSKMWWECYNGAGANTSEYQQFEHGTHYKWALGGDPHDASLMQTTRCALYSHGDGEYDSLQESGFTYGGPVFNPNDYSIFYHCAVNVEGANTTMLKWQFVSNGEAILEEDWLGWDELSWEDPGIAIGWWSQKPSSYTDREYIYVQSPGLHQKEAEWNKLRCVSFDGEEIFDKMMHDWYMPDDPNPHAYINGAFHIMYSRTPYHWLIVSHTSCMHQMIDTTRLVIDADDEEDMVIWQNSNGDYFLDSAYNPDVEPAWYCLADDKTVSARRTAVSIDSNGFNVFGVGYMGLNSLAVSTQDGTGLGHFKFADDTVSEDISEKDGSLLCDNGSNYDGLYCSATLTLDTPAAIEVDQTFFVAFDSVGGIISTEPVAVEEDAQAAFGVDQNSPNPFNPTTSISFTISDNNHVSVDIYNVAGQKVDTLVNDFMDAGTHSVVWDASGFSNGVYFYTVKSGDFSKTMKMTLVK